MISFGEYNANCLEMGGGLQSDILQHWEDGIPKLKIMFTF